MTVSSPNLAPVGPSPRNFTRDPHVNVLIVAALVVIGSFSLRVVGTDRVAFFFAPVHPLPTVCFTRAWLGIDCPACGLTRSFVCLAHGQWRASRAFHPLGWVVAGFVLFQFPYRLAVLAGARPIAPVWTGRITWILLASLAAVWLAKFV